MGRKNPGIPRLSEAASTVCDVALILHRAASPTALAEQLGSSYAIERLTSVKGFRILAIERLDDGGPLPLPASDDVSRSSDA